MQEVPGRGDPSSVPASPPPGAAPTETLLLLCHSLAPIKVPETMFLWPVRTESKREVPGSRRACGNAAGLGCLSFPALSSRAGTLHGSSTGHQPLPQQMLLLHCRALCPLRRRISLTRGYLTLCG